MATANFGIVRPLPFNKLEKGMLVVLAPRDGERQFGVVTKIREDWILASLSSADGDAPTATDLAYHTDDLWHIPGTLEIEPKGGPFEPLLRRSSAPTFTIDSDGNVGALLEYSEIGMPQQFLIDLANGEHMGRSEKMAFFKEAKFYIRQEGRHERFEWPSLTPEQ